MAVAPVRMATRRDVARHSRTGLGYPSRSVTYFFKISLLFPSFSLCTFSFLRWVYFSVVIFLGQRAYPFFFEVSCI